VLPKSLGSRICGKSLQARRGDDRVPPQAQVIDRHGALRGDLDRVQAIGQVARRRKNPVSAKRIP
jgi:hypothetical protein